MIDEKLEEESNYLSFSDQILNHAEKEIIEMELDIVDSTSDLLPWVLTTKYNFQGVI